MNGTGAKASAGLVCAAVALLLFLGPAPAQTKGLSDGSVQVLMNYAWTLTPPTFTSPSGKKIVVDKTKRETVVVPLDVAREVIMVGRLSAYGQACNLVEEQRANYLTMMKRFEAESKYTDQQLLYITQLHMTTIMMLTGQLVVVEKDGEKTVSERELKAGRVQSCTDNERERIKGQIMAYVESSGTDDKSGTVKTGATPPPKK